MLFRYPTDEEDYIEQAFTCFESLTKEATFDNASQDRIFDNLNRIKRIIYGLRECAREKMAERLRVSGLFIHFVNLMKAKCYFREQIILEVSWVLIYLFGTSVECVDQLLSEDLIETLMGQIGNSNPAVLDNVC